MSHIKSTHGNYCKLWFSNKFSRTNSDRKTSSFPGPRHPYLAMYVTVITEQVRSLIYGCLHTITDLHMHWLYCAFMVRLILTSPYCEHGHAVFAYISALYQTGDCPIFRHPYVPTPLCSDNFYIHLRSSCRNIGVSEQSLCWNVMDLSEYRCVGIQGCRNIGLWQILGYTNLGRKFERKGLLRDGLFSKKECRGGRVFQNSKDRQGRA